MLRITERKTVKKIYGRKRKGTLENENKEEKEKEKKKKKKKKKKKIENILQGEDAVVYVISVRLR